MVRFGLLHLFESAGGRSERAHMHENVEMVEHAEAVGLDSVWLAEHHFTDYGVMPSTQVFGAYLAARTTRIRIGTGVVVLPFHNPIRVAEEFAFLDQLSDGRLDFGVGRGYQPAEFKSYGIPHAESRERYDECLEVIRQAWTRDAVDFSGKYYSYSGVKIRPRPAQRPCPPIFGSSFNPDTVPDQADRDVNLLFTPLLTPPSKVAEYRQRLTARGKHPADYRVGGLVFVYVDEDRERALRDFEDPCMWYYKTFTRMIPAKEYPEAEGYYRTLHATMSAFIGAYEEKQLSFAQAVESGPFHHGFLIGDPAYVREKLRGLFQMYGGLTDVLCWTRLGGLDHRKVMRSMELFHAQVIEPMRAAGELEVA